MGKILDKMSGIKAKINPKTLPRKFTKSVCFSSILISCSDNFFIGNQRCPCSTDFIAVYTGITKNLVNIIMLFADSSLSTKIVRLQTGYFNATQFAVPVWTKSAMQINQSQTRCFAFSRKTCTTCYHTRITDCNRNVYYIQPKLCGCIEYTVIFGIFFNHPSQERLSDNGVGTYTFTSQQN